MRKHNELREQLVLGKIYIIRGCKVMLDEDLALLYELETRRLNEQVKRNIERFPDDFMFQLTKEEWSDLISQFATSNQEKNNGRGGRRKLPYVFTEHGILMLSSVLNSKQAIAVNIQIMRVFLKMRALLLEHKDLALKIGKMEGELSQHAKDIRKVFDYLSQFFREQKKPRKRIGYK